MKISAKAVVLLALAPGLIGAGALAHEGEEHEGSAEPARQSLPPQQPAVPAIARDGLQPLPAGAPRWLFNTKRNHIYPRRGVYNDAVYQIAPLARDLNAVAVGHAMAYEDLVTGRAGQLETATFARIRRILDNPPRLMPDEGEISPTFGRKFGVLEQVFDWTHVLHAQTVDVLASTKLTEYEKEKEIEALWQFYFRSVPYALTPLPMNMEWLDSQVYSGAFRKKHPKVNGLFWGYHWLQGSMYDGLYGLTLQQQKSSYQRIGRRYHQVELAKTNRPFMPMFAETSPKFAARFPAIANAFDNLHMLHDMVNDILAFDGLTEKQKHEQVLRAIYLVSAAAHEGERPGQGDAGAGVHDHRYPDGMPGMGMMKGSTTEVMYMPGMGWMSMSDCHHCSMGLPEGSEQWRASTVSAEGWTMRVRCALCARDMSRETKGEAILRLPLEVPGKSVIVFVDEDGSMSTETPEVLFLEEEGGHARCNMWSRAFSNRAAYEAFAQANPRYAGGRLLTFQQWAAREADETPDTYVKPQGAVENPYLPEQAEGDAE